jgi:hypothetical protein
MAAAAITPRESATDLSPSCFPALIFIPASELEFMPPNAASKSFHR